METRIRFDVSTSNRKVLYLKLKILPNVYRDFVVLDSNIEGNKFEIIIHGEFTGFSVAFLERQEGCEYSFGLPSMVLGKNIGIVLVEDSNDCSLSVVNYYSVAPENIIDTKYFSRI